MLIYQCEKCQQQFGRHGNIFQVLSEASLSILYHHGLEVCDFESDVNNDDDLEESRYMKSLPMHAMLSGLGSHSLSIIKTLDSMELQRCKYGMGSTLSHRQHAKNIQYMHNLDEAMRIDTYSAGDDECLARRSTYTGALLFSMFDIGSSFIHSDKKNHPKMTGDIKSFEDYAIQIDDAIFAGVKWIQSVNSDASITNQIKIMVVQIHAAHIGLRIHSHVVVFAVSDP